MDNSAQLGWTLSLHPSTPPEGTLGLEEPPGSSHTADHQESLQIWSKKRGVVHQLCLAVKRDFFFLFVSNDLYYF